MDTIEKSIEAPSLFKCFACGATSVTVEHIYKLVQRVTLNAPCSCTKGAAFAIQVKKYREIHLSEKSVIDNDHGYEYGTPIPMNESDWTQLSKDVGCQECAEKSAQLQPEDFTVDIENQEYFVRCDGCKREIPFSWSHPERSGRIWPVEFTDYRPDKGWPEPRYGNKYQRQRRAPFVKKY